MLLRPKELLELSWLQVASSTRWRPQRKGRRSGWPAVPAAYRLHLGLGWNSTALSPASRRSRVQPPEGALLRTKAPLLQAE